MEFLFKYFLFQKEINIEEDLDIKNGSTCHKTLRYWISRKKIRKIDIFSKKLRESTRKIILLDTCRLELKLPQ